MDLKRKLATPGLSFMHPKVMSRETSHKGGNAGSGSPKP